MTVREAKCKSVNNFFLIKKNIAVKTIAMGQNILESIYIQMLPHIKNRQNHFLVEIKLSFIDHLQMLGDEKHPMSNQGVP